MKRNGLHPLEELETVTPDMEEVVARCRGDLRAWLDSKQNEGTPHAAALTALALLAASGAVSSGIPRESFVSVMGEYYDAYKNGVRS